MSTEPNEPAPDAPVTDLDPLALFHRDLEQRTAKLLAMDLTLEDIVAEAMAALSDGSGYELAYDMSSRKFVDTMIEEVQKLREGKEMRAAQPSPMAALLEKMLEEAAATVAADQTPAIDCQVILRSAAPVIGSLKRSTVPGIYQMLAPAQGPNGQRLMAEVYFEAEDVVALAQQREMSPIAHPPPGGKLFTRS